MLDSIVDTIASFYDAYLFLTVPLFIVVGLAMAFYGLIISQIVAWLIGFLWGAIVGVVIGYPLGGEIGALAGFILLGSIMGGISLWLVIVTPKLIGFFAAYLPMLLLLQPEGLWHLFPLTLGFVGAWFGGFLSRSFIIMTSSLTGAWMATASVLRLYGRFDDDFYGNVFDAIAHYSLIAVSIYCVLAVSGILKQYGVFAFYRGFDPFFKELSLQGSALGSQDNRFGEFVTYCLDKTDFDNPSKGFQWTHALVSWLLALIFLGTVPVLFYAADVISQILPDSVILGWVQMKGILGLLMAAYFGIAFYQSIRSLNNSRVPEWTVRVTFRWGIVLAMVWMIASMVPLVHGHFDVDGALVLFMLVPMVLQYRHENRLELVPRQESP